MTGKMSRSRIAEKKACLGNELGPISDRLSGFLLELLGQPLSPDHTLNSNFFNPRIEGLEEMILMIRRFIYGEMPNFFTIQNPQIFTNAQEIIFAIDYSRELLKIWLKELKELESWLNSEKTKLAQGRININKEDYEKLIISIYEKISYPWDSCKINTLHHLMAIYYIKMLINNLNNEKLVDFEEMILSLRKRFIYILSKRVELLELEISVKSYIAKEKCFFTPHN
jgi:protein associated with RNAse G/E